MSVLPPARGGFEARQRVIGQARFNHKKPFCHRAQPGGRAPVPVPAPVIIRYYHQLRIPMKDASFVLRAEDHRLRRIQWYRIGKHDGLTEGTGGIGHRLKPAEDAGLDPGYVRVGRGIRAATRFAVDAQVRLARKQPLLRTAAPSLTAFFEPKIRKDCMAGLIQNHLVAKADTICDVRCRTGEATRDIAFGLERGLERTVAKAVEVASAVAVVSKTDMRRAQLDALRSATVDPCRMSPCMGLA